MRNFHNEDEERLYHSWSIMRQNCTNPKSQDYASYGARGIKFCDEWNDFDEFFIWAVTHGYKKGKVLKRMDARGDFCPENCCFADASTARTGIRANSFTVTYNGSVYTNESFARAVNINPRKTLRLLKAGKTAEEIVAERTELDRYVCYGHSENSVFLTDETKANQPNSRARKLYTVNGVTASLTELCEKFGNGISRKEAQRRISKGWTVEAAVLTPCDRKK